MTKKLITNEMFKYLHKSFEDNYFEHKVYLDHINVLKITEGSLLNRIMEIQTVGRFRH